MATSYSPLNNPDKFSFGTVVSRIMRLFSDDPMAGKEDPSVFASDTEARRHPGDGANGEYQASLSDQTYDKMRVEAGRLNAYKDYDLMDSEEPIISSALDIISEFSTQGDNPQSETFNIVCDEQTLVKYIQDKVNVLELHTHITPTAREIAKYGCAFWELIADDNDEIHKIKPLPTPSMERNEDKKGQLKKLAFTQKDRDSGKDIASFPNWQIIQGRYVKTFGRKYGNSLLESARRVYKQFQIMLDGMVIQRTYRSHMRYMFSIPVDGMSAEQADAYLRRKRLDFRKKERLNSTFGKPESFQAPMGANEDFFIGVRKEGVAADVKTIQGAGGLSELGDIELLMNELIVAVAVPKGLLGMVKDLSSRTTLTEQSVQFARRLYRMQQIIGAMVRETLRRCMILDGVDPEKYEWSVVLPSISTVDDLRQWQISALKAMVAQVYGQKLPIVDREHIYTKILELPAEEVERLKALPPEEFGIAPMTAAPQADPAFGSANDDAGLPASDPMAQQRARTEWNNFTNDDIVHSIRRRLGITDQAAALAGELKLAQQLRELKENFGDVAIDQAMLVDSFIAARSGSNGHAS